MRGIGLARGRVLAAFHAVRSWALAHPAEYGLLYGDPVPGYAAPQDTVAPASKVILLLAAIVAEAPAGPDGPPVPRPVRADLRRLIDSQPGDLSEERLDRVLFAWTHLFGQVNFEVFHRLDDMVQARAEYFEHHVNLLADLVCLP